MNLKSVIRLPAKAGAWYVASGAMIKLCGMSATPYFTRVMSPEESGRYSLYMSWAALPYIAECRNSTQRAALFSPQRSDLPSARSRYSLPWR